MCQGVAKFSPQIYRLSVKEIIIVTVIDDQDLAMNTDTLAQREQRVKSAHFTFSCKRRKRRAKRTASRRFTGHRERKIKQKNPKTVLKKKYEKEEEDNLGTGKDET